MRDPRPATEPASDGGVDAPRAVPIAIIGMACVFPRAPGLQAFWNNIVGGVDAVGEPVPNWDAQRYLAAGRIKTQYGGYLGDLYRFDPREFGIMPNSLDGGEPDQFLALKVARDALADAGYAGPDADHRDTGVILGHSTYLHRGQVTVVQTDIVVDQTLELVKAALPDADPAALAKLRALLAAKVPPMNSDTAPGLVPNVMTGRIANRLNLKGPNHLVDAACSSSLLAVGVAIDELRAGRSRMMLAGGVNASLPADVTTIFTQLGALSGRGRVRPFEDGSDGTLLGEGLGMLVLKRLPDALADGDRVYALIHGVGQSSDGRGTGLLAPSQDGETLAIRRTYEAAGIDPASVSLVEAHGTGIPLGDRTEVAALRAVFGDRRTAVATKALGSVKSMISHCIPAAGAASLIKTALALHHRVLPPTLCERVNPALGLQHTPFYVNTEARPWIHREGVPRRAGVNAFGFGGTNSHAILEQAPAEAARPASLADWPAELCVLSAATHEALVAALERLAAGVERNPQWRVAEVAAALARADRGERFRLSLVVRDLPALAKGIRTALARLAEGRRADRWSARGGLSYGDRREDGLLAFLFPGEGSQYPAMFAELAPCFPVVQRWLDFWHGLYGLPEGETRTDVVFPTCEVDATRRRELEQRLHDMDVGSEAVFIGGMAMHELLTSLGVDADVMLGHSSGESAALGASGANPAALPSASAEDRLACIAKHYAAYERLLAAGRIPTGALLAVGALPTDEVERHVAAEPGVVVAMDNCANQMVLFGPVDGIARVQAAMTAEGGICMPLPFDRGYHTPAFADAAREFAAYYKDIGLGLPKLPLYSCATADRFPKTVAGVRKLAAAQWAQKVRFRETVLKMHDDGVRLFVEVGPSSKLTAFVNDVLIDRDFSALSTNVRRKNGVEQVLAVLGALYTAGRGPVLGRLFEGRAITPIDLDGAPVAPRGAVLDNTLPMIRLDAAEREAVRALLAPAGLGAPVAVAPRQGAAEPAPAASPATASAPRPAAATDDAIPSAATDDAPSAPAPHPPVEAGEVAEVMSGYFGLMRDFLERQQALAEVLAARESSWPPGGSESDADRAAAVDEAADLGFEPAAPARRASTHARAGFTPLLDTVVEHVAGPRGHVVARCAVSLPNDAFLRDHVMSGPPSAGDPALFGLSCVPFTVSLEAMAEACALLAGHAGVRAIADVKAFDWIALDDDAVEFEVRARTVDAAAGHHAAEVRVPRHGGWFTVLSATFEFAPAAGEGAPPWRLSTVPPLAEPRESVLNAPHLYATGMFHGPVFQSMAYVQAWDDSGIDVELGPVSLAGFFEPGHVPQLVLNPVLLDAMGQVVACWLVQYVGTDFHSFPSTIARLELHEVCPADRDGVLMRMRQRPVDPQASDIQAPRAWAFECTDAAGRVLMRGDGFVNLFFRVPRAYHEVRMDPWAGWFGAPLAEGLAPDGVWLWQVPMMSEEFCAVSGSIALRILAHAVLAAEERPGWRALEKSPLRKRREWLFGRAALKEAVRAWVHAATGELPFPSDVVVGHDAAGAPYVTGAWAGTSCDAPAVSLSHDATVCLVAVAPPGSAVGVDREALARVRRPEWLQAAFGEAESRLLDGLAGPQLDERLLRLWCAKEAAAKALGTGLLGRPEAFVVEALDAGCGQLVVRHGGSAVGTLALRVDDAVIAIACHDARPGAASLTVPAAEPGSTPPSSPASSSAAAFH